MKTGGYVFLSTHRVWPPHGFHGIFGALRLMDSMRYSIEIVTIVEGLPCKVYSLVDGAPARKNYYQTLKQQGVALIAKKVDTYRSDLLKYDIEVEEVVNNM